MEISYRKGADSMNWKIFLYLFFRNVVLGIVIGAAMLGIFGYVVGGQVGFINGAYWGAVLGLIGGVFSGITLLYRFWEQPVNYQMFPEYNWFVKKEEEKKDL
jgi:membrane associated rhomboid family serine protease